LIVFMLWYSGLLFREAPSSQLEVDSIAILPFVNDSGDEDSEYLSEGVAATISSSLSQLAELRVLPSSALDRYRGQKVDPQTASRELDVRAVLTGTVLRRGETLGVRVELVDGSENRLLWGEQYTETFADIFKLQEQIARQIADALRLQLTPEEHKRLVSLGTENPKAYEYYLKGQFHGEWIDLAQAIPYYEQAIEEDPSYALACVALSAAHQWLGFFLTSEEHYRRARQPAERALEIDPESSIDYLVVRCYEAKGMEEAAFQALDDPSSAPSRE